MNEQERADFEQLKQRHYQLERELALLAKQMAALEQTLAVSRQAEAYGPPAESILKSPPAAMPPRAAEVVPALPTAEQTDADALGVPPVIVPASTPPGEDAPRPSPWAFEPIQTSTAIPLSGQSESSPPQPLTPPSLPSMQESVGKERSFEMQLGTYWLVRIGIVMVLTALVFFGNYAYQNFIVRLGAPGKISLLYLASTALLCAGAWWQRKAAKESLKNYAQVLFAGGMASVYFTTYAAHHFEHLRVIASPILDGTLLLAWTGFMVWIADRKRSEVLALFAVGLAYYTSVITRVGQFTLYSNLLLTAAAVFFLVRNRWAALSFATLVASYGAYSFWRFFDGRGWRWASPEEGLWLGVYFLMSYWALFTAAVFLSRNERLSGPNRAAFLTLNNGAFFTLFLLTMLQVREGGLWKFCMAYGTVLLILAGVARRFLSAEPLAKNSYLTQGLLLVTLGIIVRFSGMQLAAILAVESVTLLILGQQRKNLVLLTGAHLAAALAIGWGMYSMKRFDQPGLILGMALGALMLVNTLASHRQFTASGAGSPQFRTAYFTILALLIWLVTTWNNCSRPAFPLVLAGEALLLTLSYYLLRIREVTLFSQAYLVLALLAWLMDASEGAVSVPWWNVTLMIATTLFLSHWWQKQRVLEASSDLSLAWQGLYAMALIGLLYYWLEPRFEARIWIVSTSALALGATAYGALTRAWFIAACGQIFTITTVVQFARQLAAGKPEWYLALAPIFALSLLVLATVKWFERKPDAPQKVSAPLLQIALAYRWVALLMSVWWVQKYIPSREQVWVLGLLSMAVFLWAGWRRNQEGLLFSAVFAGMALADFWQPIGVQPKVYWPNLLTLIVLLSSQQIAKRRPENYRLPSQAQAVMIVLGGLSIWYFLSRWVLESASGFYLTATWSAVALLLFATGIVLRERVYRWLGLGILACALGRVVFFDVWKLQTLYRVLSFLALGIVLLVLGFIYNKYQEKIREWL